MPDGTHGELGGAGGGSLRLTFMTWPPHACGGLRPGDSLWRNSAIFSDICIRYFPDASTARCYGTWATVKPAAGWVHDALSVVLGRVGLAPAARRHGGDARSASLGLRRLASFRWRSRVRRAGSHHAPRRGTPLGARTSARAGGFRCSRRDEQPCPARPRPAGGTQSPPGGPAPRFADDRPWR